MSNKLTTTTKQSHPLRKDHVIVTAIKLADAGGIEALSMRKLGRELGVEAMALYYHFANKHQLIEGMIDRIHGEITTPLKAKDWRAEARGRAHSAFEVLLRHPWAAPIMEAGVNPGSATLQDSEGTIKCFRQAGFSIDATVHAVTVLNIYIYGAAQQYAKLPFTTTEQAAGVAKEVQSQFSAEAYPYLAEMIAEHMMKTGYNALGEFDFGLNLILDGIARIKHTGGPL